MQLLISMISKNISKSHLSFTLPRQSEGATASSIRDGYFPFSLSSILTLGTSLVASSLFNFFFFRKNSGNFESYKENAFTSNSCR